MVEEFPVTKTKDEWRAELEPHRYHVLFEHGTERPFDNEYYDHWQEGIYDCAACGNQLFSSDAKFRSCSGWPSFKEAISESSIGSKTDKTLGMTRTEVHCSQCGGHLGHMFPDGPPPQRQRY